MKRLFLIFVLIEMWAGPSIRSSFAQAAAESQAPSLGTTPAAPVSDLCDSLIASMKMGASAGFAARDAFLDPHVRRDMDFALMTRIVVGPSWSTLAPEVQGRLIEAFSGYSVATYAEQFKSYGGEHFQVDPKATPTTGGDAIVHTQLFTSDPQPVVLDYRVRRSGGAWRIIDIYLNGTISQLAARRSEYAEVQRSGGAQALIDLLKKKTADLAR